MKQFFRVLLIAAIAIGTSPEGVISLSFKTSEAEARGSHRGGGGMSGRPAGRPSGAKARPSSRPSGGARPATRPSTRPSSGARPSAGARPAPSTRPSASNRPTQKPASRPTTRPGGNDKARPVGSRPPGARPGGGSRPPGAGRPPGSRPPGSRPAGGGHHRPPGYHPPHHRPPGYRPPYHRPPYYRPPHYHWGAYSYNSGWGWFFTAALVGSTLVYVADLPSDKDCEKVEDDGETLYVCDGVLYRSTFYEDEKVYEIVSDAPDEPQTVFGLALTDPMTRGDAVKELQQKLLDAGYDIGSADGVFGSSTEAALQWFQYDNELEPTGMVDAETAKLLGYEQQPGVVDPTAEGASTAAEPAAQEPKAGAVPSATDLIDGSQEETPKD